MVGSRLSLSVKRDASVVATVSVSAGARVPKRQRAAAAALAAAADCTVCFDLSFNALMDELEQRALAKQLALCYGYNRKLNKPLKLAVAGLDSARNSALLVALERAGWDAWLLQREPEPPSVAFAGRRLLYLSADASDACETVEDGGVYIIGGLVD